MPPEPSSLTILSYAGCERSGFSRRPHETRVRRSAASRRGRKSRSERGQHGPCRFSAGGASSVQPPSAISSKPPRPSLIVHQPYDQSFSVVLRRTSWEAAPRPRRRRTTPCVCSARASTHASSPPRGRSSAGGSRSGFLRPSSPSRRGRGSLWRSGSRCGGPQSFTAGGRCSVRARPAPLWCLSCHHEGAG